MSFNDWVFHRQAIGTSLLFYDLTDIAPLFGSSSLLLKEYGIPTEETVGIRQSLYPQGLVSGSIQSAFFHQGGAGFREYGIYFYSDSLDPTGGSVNCYLVTIPDSFSDVRLYQTSAGITSNSRTLIYEFLSPTIPNLGTPILVKVSWHGGVFLSTFGGLHVRISLAIGSVLQSNLVVLTPDVVIPTPLSVIRGEGIYVRSSDSSEPVQHTVDRTKISQVIPLG